MKIQSQEQQKRVLPKTLKPIELKEEDLATIVGGNEEREGDNALSWNHHETVVGNISPQANTQSQSTPIIELSRKDLAAIAGGFGCPASVCGANHNEMLVSRIFPKANTQSKSIPVVELSLGDLKSIVGGGEEKEKEDNIISWNHNETVVDDQTANKPSNLRSNENLLELTLEEISHISGGGKGVNQDPPPK
ncbi:MAG: hypothetical protein F6K42_35970 [Leptolyngbya sp. SIO1D8]|nr:hypothetical protein [Leptolyngbya sp. SIO1D8]